MKPDWKDTPKWANYLAVDKSGKWNWYKDKPFKDSFEQEWDTFGEWERAELPSWKDSLEQRPTDKRIDDE
jgi:hypothetical protein